MKWILGIIAIVLVFILTLAALLSTTGANAVKTTAQRQDVCRSNVRQDYMNAWDKCCESLGKQSWCQLPKGQACTPAWSTYEQQLTTCN